jgi:acyl-CoA thioester hydrolase
MTNALPRHADVPDLTPRRATFDLAAYSIPHPSPYVCDIFTGAQHVSRAVEHVSNIEYVRWLDRAAELHADSLGYTRARLHRDGVMWFVARHEIDYLAEAWPDDRLVIATWVRDMGKVKSWRDYAIVRPSDQTVICRAATLWVLVALDTRRPKRIDREMAERFQPMDTLRV